LHIVSTKVECLDRNL